MRAKMSVSLRETAMRMLTVNRSLSGRPIDTVRVEAQSVAKIAVQDGEGDLIDVSFKSPGLWGFMKLPRDQAVQLALSILKVCDAEHLIHQEAA